jgi:hypothetical protein
VSSPFGTPGSCPRKSYLTGQDSGARPSPGSSLVRPFHMGGRFDLWQRLWKCSQVILYQILTACGALVDGLIVTCHTLAEATDICGRGWIKSNL